ncbi:sensor histidine kinase [Pacificispira sp.]|uniref:sensor histidine kinase n=1 Tax=Pacificispira sp. TaxID=2888761 RepID=UPI003BAA08C4
MKSLSARLLLLTIIFVMAAEVLIFVPSVARFRETYIHDRMVAAHLSVLVLDATPDGMVSEELTQELLGFVEAYSVAARRGDLKLSLMLESPPDVDATVRPDSEGPMTMVAEAFAALTQDESRVLRIVGPSPRNPAVELEIVMEDGPLCEAILAFAFRVFWLSLAISLITALLVFLVLRRQLVRPLKRLIRNMARFRAHPENQNTVIRPSGRRDEVGVAERELAAMQTTIRDALTQRKHLAALGTAVAKINHDLRGILSSALVVSDRLENSEDPEVRRIAPGILDAIERAAALCGRTLNYAGQEGSALRFEPVPLADLIADAGFGLPNEARLKCRVEPSVTVHGDRAQLYRVFGNLLRNAAEAGATEIAVDAQCRDGAAEITVSDNGPGLPPRAQQNLFKPFEGSARAGGTGLGLSIARELARDHGGELALRSTGANGTVFALRLPDRPTQEDL